MAIMKFEVRQACGCTTINTITINDIAQRKRWLAKQSCLPCQLKNLLLKYGDECLQWRPIIGDTEYKRQWGAIARIHLVNDSRAEIIRRYGWLPPQYAKRIPDFFTWQTSATWLIKNYTTSSPLQLLIDPLKSEVQAEEWIFRCYGDTRMAIIRIKQSPSKYAEEELQNAKIVAILEKKLQEPPDKCRRQISIKNEADTLIAASKREKIPLQALQEAIDELEQADTDGKFADPAYYREVINILKEHNVSNSISTRTS